MAAAWEKSACVGGWLGAGCAVGAGEIRKFFFRVPFHEQRNDVTNRRIIEPVQDRAHLLPPVAGRQPVWEVVGCTPMSEVSSVTRSRTRLRSVDSRSAVCGVGFTEASMSKTVCGRCHAENHSRPRP